MAGQLPAVKPLLRSPKGNRICPFYPFFEGGLSPPPRFQSDGSLTFVSILNQTPHHPEGSRRIIGKHTKLGGRTYTQSMAEFTKQNRTRHTCLHRVLPSVNSTHLPHSRPLSSHEPRTPNPQGSDDSETPGNHFQKFTPRLPQ